MIDFSPVFPTKGEDLMSLFVDPSGNQDDVKIKYNFYTGLYPL